MIIEYIQFILKVSIFFIILMVYIKLYMILAGFVGEKLGIGNFIIRLWRKIISLWYKITNK